MATLTGNQIDQSYSGLIKTTDNAAIGATEKEITDGLGTASTLKLGTTSASFTGTLDLTGATVTGLPDVDTTYDLAAVANGANIDLNLTGSDATTDTVSIVAGTNITLSEAAGVVTIDAASTPAGLVNGTGTDSLKQADTLTTNAANASGPQAIAIGNGANATGSQAVTIGNYSEATNVGCASIGEYASATGLYSSAWGRTAAASGDGAVAFGQQSQANQAGAVAMGRQVQSDTADTTHVRALKIVAPDAPGALGGNGITFLSPDGTAGVVTLLDTDELALDGVAIGGGAAGLVSGVAADSMISASTLTTNPASALCVRGIALGDNARAATYANQVDGVAIGTNALSEATNSIAIGKDAWGQSGDEIAIGTGAHSRLGDGIAIGRSAYAGNTGNIAIGKLANCDYQYTGVIALGTDTVCSANGAIAIGASVTAATVNTVTVKKLQMLDYATMDYADDTAAATGGIPLGGLYHTSGALKIRIA
jgi:trimeric autotransporter adhesin